MRITVDINNVILIDDDDVAEIASFVKALRNGRAPKRQSRTARKKLELESKEVPLSNALVETWNWLVAHDDAKGINSREVAKGLDVKEHTATYRLNRLVEKELAHKTRPGRYRAGDS